VEQKVRYAVMDMTDQEVIELPADKNREDAIRIAEQWGKRFNRQFMPVSQTITYGDWEPFNTGIVPPYINTKIERQWEQGDTRV
jgi:hypothetical protein